jgi:hypothetical protein
MVSHVQPTPSLGAHVDVDTLWRGLLRSHLPMMTLVISFNRAGHLAVAHSRTALDSSPHFVPYSCSASMLVPQTVWHYPHSLPIVASAPVMGLTLRFHADPGVLSSLPILWRSSAAFIRAVPHESDTFLPFVKALLESPHVARNQHGLISRIQWHNRFVTGLKVQPVDPLPPHLHAMLADIGRRVGLVLDSTQGILNIYA